MRNAQVSVRESWIAERLKPFLGRQGFTWLPHLHQFRKSTERGFTCIILSVSDHEESSLVEAHLGIRIDDVENIAFPFTNGLPGFQPDSMTIVTPLAKLYGQPFQRFEVASQRSAAEAVVAIQGQLQDKGLKFLNQYSSLEDMEALYNEKPEEQLQLVHNQANRCFRAVAMARLLPRKDFEQLVETYGRRLETELHAPQSTLEKYTRLVNFLRYYSQN